MRTLSIPARLASIMVAVVALVARPVAGQETQEMEAPAPKAHATGQVRAYENAITETESREGAYAGGLSESLLGLALTLQSQGRHEEAIEAFRRGIHLTRINEGLYCPQQIPLLQGEIASDIAVNDYAQADERQKYLYRVQMRSLQSGDALADALMQQAKWQYDVYRQGPSPQGYTRLMDMWELYRQALRDVIDREGEKSPKLLPPLHGMLQAQYLISGYEWQESDQVFVEDGRIDETLLRFKSYRAQSYQQGNAVIDAISGIERERTPADNATLAETMVMLGDWRLWNGKSEAAWEAYREAEIELAREENAQLQVQRLFGEPVALPDIVGLDSLPPTVDAQEADVLLAFGVSKGGRVQDLERVDDNEAEDARARRLMRQLRQTTFRPRFEAGQPVETEKIVKAFDIVQ